MGYTLWMFLLTPDGTVERYPRARFDRFFEGKKPLAVEIAGEARFVEVAIETRRGHPLRMVRSWFTRYELEPDRFVSRDHLNRKLRDAAISMDIALSGGAGEKVVSLEPFIARRESRLEHGWHPDEYQLERIVAAINHDAAKDLVTTDGETLIPL